LGVTSNTLKGYWNHLVTGELPNICQMLQDLNSNICFRFRYNFEVLLNLIYVVVKYSCLLTKASGLSFNWFQLYANWLEFNTSILPSYYQILLSIAFFLECVKSVWAYLTIFILILITWLAT